jgi:multicomponent Na+:H+ antiporter subunit A
MSMLTITLGVAAFPFYDRISDALEQISLVTTAVHPTTVYDGLLTGTDRASAAVGRYVHNGLIRTYVWWVLLSGCLLTVGGYATTAVGVPTPAFAETPLAIVLVLGVAIVAAVAVTTAKSHATGVLTLGILGFMVAIFYILASGPDLALTQLVVETLLLLIFLLVLEELPAYYGELDRSRAVKDGALSVFVGLTAFLSVLYAAPGAGAPPTPTAEFFTQKAVPKGGGGNIVNVILTDFRAFDTLGESIVIVLAALSVLVLLTMRDRGETR